ncbi:MAG: hypothetical protein HY852_19450 [Bradyrhizobium sp.]|uniref:peptidoglycan-binding domain-containing protein n=1 Tax=Bradyrhizobium sp. TaxID=376 RepID=UPI0025C55783|nr:peptidoglycan-binding domain-containing protein [Bradyrhizobium sp.]MBI5263987.1 hypothetical protein [Bradyrhizobium sp.]
MDQADIARLLQAHLKRVGCNPGNVDGSWDDASKAALESFNKNAQTKLNVQLATLDALASVLGKTERVRPLVARKGQRADGDRCIQVNCESGYFLNSSGACEKKPEPRPSLAQSEETIIQLSWVEIANRVSPDPLSNIRTQQEMTLRLSSHAQ